MPFISYDHQFRWVLAVCDRCSAVLGSDGRTLAKKAHEFDPDELSPHFNESPVLLQRADLNGWGTAGRMVCPGCMTGRRG